MRRTGQVGEVGDSFTHQHGDKAHGHFVERARSRAWAAILALAMATSLSPAICLAAAIPLATLPAKVMVVHGHRPGAGDGSPRPPGRRPGAGHPSRWCGRTGAARTPGRRWPPVPPQQLRAAFIDRERPAFAGAGHGHRGRLIPAEQLRDPSCGLAMNPSSDTVMCETTLPIRYPPAGGLHDDERHGRSEPIGDRCQHPARGVSARTGSRLLVSGEYPQLPRSLPSGLERPAMCPNA